MLKVLVVEDEEMIRKGIVLAVDWAALDCVVVGEAANGLQALEAVDGRPAGTCELSPCRTLESSLNLARDKGAEAVLVLDKDGERTVGV